MTITLLPPLYKETKLGKIELWQVGHEGNEVVVISGFTDGQKTEFRTETTAKNVGRANATTAEEQAALEARSRWDKKRKHSYVEDPSGKNTLSYTRPMLAEPYLKHSAKVEWPWYVQPKLDGVRCLARNMGDGIVRYTSRNGTEFTGLDFLTPEVLLLIPIPGEELDGELYHHGLSLQEIVSKVRKIKEIRTEGIQYHVFDIVDTGSVFSARLDDLRLRFEGVESPLQHMCLVSTRLAQGSEECDQLLSVAMDRGYEGLILRNPNGAYLPNFRSHDLLKYKVMQDAEFEIVGYRFGRGKDKNIAIYRCKTVEGEEFEVKMKGTYEQNEALSSRADALVGKRMTVQFQEFTPYGVPEFPVGLAIRDYE